MASTVAAQTRDFARRFFEVVLALGHDDWVSAQDAFEGALAAHPDHPYVASLQANRARRADFGAAAERVRAKEFPQIERRKAGTRRNAPVLYRVGRASAGFSLQLPYDVPPSHPLRSAAESPRSNPLRREPGPQDAGSPWRRRQAVRRAVPDSSSGTPSSAGWWQKLTGDAAALLDRVTRIAARRWR
jgi:hypothetical protein